MVEPIPFRKNETCDGDDQNTDTPASEESHTKEDLRTYTNEEVSEIIRLALRSVDNEDRDTVSHSEMLVIGKDFGLSPEDIERAFVEADKTQQTEELEKQARIIFLIHAATFAVINVGLLLLNLLTGIDKVVWFVYPLVPWGAVLGVHWVISRFVLNWLTDMAKELDRTNAVAHGDPLCMDFTIPDLFGSMAEAKGIAHIEDSVLSLEFETRDTIFGALKSKPKEVRVPLQDITTVQLDRGLWQTKLRLRGRKLHCFTEVPGSSGGEAVLVIARQSRLAAERFARVLTEQVAKER